MSDLSNFDCFPINLVKKSDDGAYIYDITQRFSASINFPAGSRIALNSLSCYYSWYNITSAFNNNVLQYKNHDGTSYTITISDGYYSISDINDYIHFVMKSNGHYLVDGDGNEVYYIKIEENPVYNKFTLTCDPVPATLPVGYTNPATWVLPATPLTMEFVVPSTNIRTVLGFTAGSYPASTQATTYMVNSTSTPQITDILSVYLHTPLVNNGFYNSNMSDVLYTFSPNVPFASFINKEPSNLVWCPLHNNSFNEVHIRFTDQLNRPLQLTDYNYQLNLLLAIPKSKK